MSVEQRLSIRVFLTGLPHVGRGYPSPMHLQLFCSKPVLESKTASAAVNLLVDRGLGLQNDQASPADTGLLTKTPIVARIELGLKSNLPAAWYVMM
jgi:hypothetical protein